MSTTKLRQLGWGHGFLAGDRGRVWMLHHVTRDRGRPLTAEEREHLLAGWESGLADRRRLGMERVSA